MKSGSKVCLFLLLLILFWFMIDLCASGGSGSVVDTFETLKDLTTNTFGANKIFTASNGGVTIDATTAPSSSSSVPSDEDLNRYFQNPSKDLGVPDQTAFFQNVPTADEKAETEAITAFSKQMNNDITKDSFSIKDFLPQEINEEWFQTDLSNNKKELDQAALIDISKFCQGVDTVGQSLKNASHDIRGNIPNPKIAISPFLNSSYDADTNIKSWC